MERSIIIEENRNLENQYYLIIIKTEPNEQRHDLDTISEYH